MYMVCQGCDVFKNDVEFRENKNFTDEEAATLEASGADTVMDLLCGGCAR